MARISGTPLVVSCNNVCQADGSVLRYTRSGQASVSSRPVYLVAHVDRPMKKNDVVGLGLSLCLHILAVVGLAFIVTGTQKPEMEELGYVAIEFGPIAEGRPVRVGETSVPPAPQPSVEPRKPAPRRTPPRPVQRQVQAPKQNVVSEEKVQPARKDEVAPEPEQKPTEATETEAVSETTASSHNSGATGGTSGAADGAEGTGSDAAKTSPFDIEGLNRRPLHAPLPRYAEKINATIKIRITVDPQGRVKQAFPLVKGNSPALEQAAIGALRQWRFNPLPANAPQVDQTGAVTFRFRLE